MTRTLSLTIAAGLLVTTFGLPSFLSAQEIQPIPETPAESEAENASTTVVCPEYKWMEWGSYTSYYALEHTINGGTCDQGTAINYDGPNDLTPLPRRCTDGNCISAFVPAGEKEGAKLNEPITRAGHGYSAVELPAPLSEFHTNRSFYNRHCQKGYRVHGRDTSRQLLQFNVVNTEGMETPVYVVARRIRLVWRDPRARPESWPESHFEYVGQEVSSDAPENGRGRGASRFTSVADIGGEVEKIDDHVVHVKIPQDDGSWWIYQIVTATEIRHIR
ncbi:MAG: hypothetical protein ACF8TS_00020 [Maioricimonas sp. JB049]